MTKIEKIRLAVALTSLTVAVTLAVRSMIETHREEAAKRDNIETDTSLDVAAINRAAAVVNAQIENGAIRSMRQLTDSVRNEIAFQKIAIREED